MLNWKYKSIPRRAIPRGSIPRIQIQRSRRRGRREVAEFTHKPRVFDLVTCIACLECGSLDA